MEKKRLMAVLLSASVGLAGLFLFGCQPTDRQSNSWQSGNTFTMKVSMVSDMLLPLGIPNADHKVSDVWLKYEVKEVEDGFPSLVTVHITALKASVDTMGVSCDYDSSQSQMPEYDKNDKRYRQKEEFWQMFSDLVGQQYTARLNSQGQVTELLEVSDKIRNAMDCSYFGSTGGDQLTFLFSESNLRQFVEAAFRGGLEGNRPKAGMDWQGQSVAEIPRAEAVMAAQNYKLDQIRQEGRQQIADISYQIVSAEGVTLPEHYPARYERVKGKIGMKILEVAGQGQIQYSLSDGRLLKLDEQKRIRIVPAKGVAPAGKKTRENKMFYQIHTTVEYQEE